MRAPHIKWTAAQRKKLSAAVSKFNAKITRERKKNPELAPYLPSKLSVSNLREKITTANDLNRLVSSVNRIFKADALKPIVNKHGVVTTVYELNEAKVAVRKINRDRDKERKVIVGTPEYQGTSASVRANTLSPKKIDFENATTESWLKFIESVEKQMYDKYSNERKLRMRDNYITAINENLNSLGQPIVDLVASIPIDTFVSGVLNDSELSFDMPYSQYAPETTVSIILEHWEAYINGPVDSGF